MIQKSSSPFQKKILVRRGFYASAKFYISRLIAVAVAEAYSIFSLLRTHPINSIMLFIS